MLVAATTSCFPDLTLDESLERLVDLEFTAVEIAIDESENQIKPSEILADVENAFDRCRKSHRLDVVNYSVGITATGDEHYQQFAAICELARITKVVSITVPSAELGTPFNEEVEHLQRLVALAHKEGVQVNIRNQSDCLAADPDTITVLCDNVDNLGLAFDPSVYICGSEVGKDPEKLIKYIRHLYLRDSSPDDYQVRVGQGTVDYGQLVHTLDKMQYRRAMSVDIIPQEGIEHSAEMRKMRLLLESLL